MRDKEVGKHSIINYILTLSNQLQKTQKSAAESNNLLVILKQHRTETTKMTEEDYSEESNIKGIKNKAEKCL